MDRDDRDEICEEVLHDEARAEEARQALVAPAMAGRLAQVFRALADPTRVRIVSALAQAERLATDGLPPPVPRRAIPRQRTSRRDRRCPSPPIKHLSNHSSVTRINGSVKHLES